MRITKTMCQTQVDMLNTTLHGDAETHIEKDNRYHSIPDRYDIKQMYGGYYLCRYCNESGAVYDVTNYQMTVRELYYVLTGINTVLRLDAHKPLLNSIIEAQGVSYAQH